MAIDIEQLINLAKFNLTEEEKDYLQLQLENQILLINTLLDIDVETSVDMNEGFRESGPPPKEEVANAMEEYNKIIKKPNFIYPHYFVFPKVEIQPLRKDIVNSFKGYIKILEEAQLIDSHYFVFPDIEIPLRYKEIAIRIEISPEP